MNQTHQRLIYMISKDSLIDCSRNISANMTKKTTHQQIIGLIAWIIICFATSAIGAFATLQAQSFYGGLVQPLWAPPAWLFGPVWTTLYAMMAVSVWLIWRKGGFKANQSALTLFLCQLILNGLWSWMFFAWHLGLGSFINIIVLWLAILANLVLFWRTDKFSGVLLVPYLLWVSFASALNYAMWQLNPSILA